MMKHCTKDAPFLSCYVDGQFLPAGEGRLPIQDGGLLYGDGIFATIRVEHGVPRFLEDHLKRLEKQCLEMGIRPPPVSRGLVEELLAKSPKEEVQRLRIIVTGGGREIFDLSPREGKLALFVEPYHLKPPAVLRMALFSKPLTVVHAHLKTLANLNRLWVLQEAKERGFDDGISLSPEGYILEASFGNLFWIVDKRLFIPDRSLPYYFGVTITKVLENNTDLELCELKCRLDEIPEEATLFRANTMGGIVPIGSIEQRTFALSRTALTSGQR